MADLLALLNLIAPFFGLIALGFFCGKVKALPEEGLAWMQFFLIYVALPVLFFRLIADKPVQELANWRFIFITTLCTYVVFALSFVVGMYFSRRDTANSVMAAVAGSYSNIGYMGPPLIIGALGPAAGAPVALIFVFDTLLLFSLIPLLMAFAGAEARSIIATAREVVWKVVTHPFNIATLLGVLASGTRLELPKWLDQMLVWLHGTAAPCALFILGVTVALRATVRPAPEVPILVFIKLVVHPLLIWVMLSAFDNFDATWTFAAMVMAALPPALNIFVLATQYRTGVERASASILIGTIVSMVTLTGLLWLIRTNRIPHDLFPTMGGGG